MDPFTASALVGAGTSLLGGMISNSSGKKESARARRAQETQWHHEREMQKSFAKNSVQWKVADAKKAGLHPLAAMGANTMSYSPQMVGDVPQHRDNTGETISKMGQNVSRAIMATQSKTQRKMSELAFDNASLKNEMLRTEVASAKARLAQQINPPINDIKDIPLQRTKNVKGAAWQEVGDVTDIGYAKTASGMAPVPSQDVTQRIEDKFVPETMHAFRSYVKPLWSDKTKPSKAKLKKYYPRATDWQWSVRNAEWQPIYKKKGRTPWKRWSDMVTKWQD